MDREDPKCGDVLGKYRLLRVMGEGGMAIVFEAEHTKLGQKAAIKVLRAELTQDPMLVERFEREGRAISKLKSRNVVRVQDVDETPSGAPYLVMELLDGWDLETELARRGSLPVVDAVGYVLQACRALGEAHAQGIVHRDIKPSNLFLTSEGGAHVLKVLDFGVAKDVIPNGSNIRLTAAEAVMGTPLYMAPEQFRGTRDADARADVWALGATLYEMLSGQPPFTGTASTIGVSIVNDPLPSLRELRPDLPATLCAVVERALEKERDRRFASASELGDALAAFSDGVVIAPRASQASMPSIETTAMGAAPTQIAVTVQTQVPVTTQATQSTQEGRRVPVMVAVLATAALVLIGAVVGLTRLGASPSSNAAVTATVEPVPVRAEITTPASALVELAPPPSASASAKHSAPIASSTVPPKAPAAKALPRSSASTTSSSQPPLFYPGN